MKRQPRLPRDRWPRLLDALRLACGLTVDEAEAVLLEQRDYVGRTPRRLLEHMERFGIRTPAEAIAYAVELYRGGMLARELERQPGPRREGFSSRPGKQKVIWSGVRTCAAGQAGLFD
jgi:hypothetical protein